MATPENPSQAPRLITAIGAFDVAAIGREIAARYAARHDFINYYSGEPRRYWQRATHKQVAQQVWALARAEQGAFIAERISVVYTAEERARLARLAWADPLTISINDFYSPEFHAAMTEKDSIRRNAGRRAWTAVLASIAVANAKAREAAR